MIEITKLFYDNGTNEEVVNLVLDYLSTLSKISLNEEQLKDIMLIDHINDVFYENKKIKNLITLVKNTVFINELKNNKPTEKINKNLTTEDFLYKY